MLIIHKNKKDFIILRELAWRVAEIASLPVQDEKRNLWRKLNGLKPERPLVLVDQLCWNEANIDDELTLLCEDDELRAWELELRRILYKWKYFPVDSVVESFFGIPMAISEMDLGVDVLHVRELFTDHTSEIYSRTYENQFETWEDLDKIRNPVIKHDEKETGRRKALAEEAFGTILPIRLVGHKPYLSVWDKIATWMGIEDALISLIDRPMWIRTMAEKIVEAYMAGLDQMEEQGLLDWPQSYIHFSGAWTDDFHINNLQGDKPLTQNMWMYGMAQMFSTVSPAMFEEFEIDVCMPLFKRFGLINYGCCDPLDLKLDEVRRIPHLRKVSMSSWVNKEKGAYILNKDYVFSAKPNPSFLAAPSFEEDMVRKDLRETIDICRKFKCPLELLLRDVSTVQYQPQRLWRWAEIAMEEVRA